MRASSVLLREHSGRLSPRPLLSDTLTPHQRAGSNRLILNDSRRHVVAGVERATLTLVVVPTLYVALAERLGMGSAVRLVRSEHESKPAAS